MTEPAAVSSGANGRMPRGARFHEDLAAHWSEGYARGGFRRRLEFADRQLRGIVKPGSRWLDAGCGSGILTRRLAAHGATGDAVDGSPAMIRVAVQASTNGEAPAAFHYHLVETVERLDFADGAFDGVLCSSVIEYLDAPLDALHEFARVLAPGGRLLVSVANRHSLVRGVQWLFRAVGSRNRFRYLEASRATFSRQEIADALRSIGIRIDAMHGFDPVLATWTTLIVPPALIFVVGTKDMPRARDLSS